MLTFFLTAGGIILYVASAIAAYSFILYRGLDQEPFNGVSGPPTGLAALAWPIVIVIIAIRIAVGAPFRAIDSFGQKAKRAGIRKRNAAHAANPDCKMYSVIGEQCPCGYVEEVEE